jgi:predicted NodU family carbamoyl transferase
VILGVNLSHDYALALHEASGMTLLERERRSRTKHHWTEDALTLEILDDWDDAALRTVEAIALTSPSLDFISGEREGRLSWPGSPRNWVYRGPWPTPDDELVEGVLEWEGGRVPGYWVSHYHAHAASALWAWGGDGEADVLCLDGAGDFGFGAAFDAAADRLLTLRERYLDWAYGLGYHEIAEAWFGANGFYEGKMMAAAAYGNADLAAPMFDGTGRPARKPETVHDLARAHETFVDEVFELVRGFAPRRPSLVCAGGCFLNVTLNHRLANSGLYRETYVPPFTGDMGTAVGAALIAARSRGVESPSVVRPAAFLGHEIAPSRRDLDEIAAEAGCTIRWREGAVTRP